MRKNTEMVNKKPCEIFGDCIYNDCGYCWIHERPVDDIDADECHSYEFEEQFR